MTTRKRQRAVNIFVLLEMKVQKINHWVFYEISSFANRRRRGRQVLRNGLRSAVGGDRQPLADVRAWLGTGVRRHVRREPRFACVRGAGCMRAACGLLWSNGLSKPCRSAVTWLLKTPLRPCSVWRPITGRSPGNGGGHHRFERQDGHQGVDCRGTARGG